MRVTLLLRGEMGAASVTHGTRSVAVDHSTYKAQHVALVDFTLSKFASKLIRSLSVFVVYLKKIYIRIFYAFTIN